MLSRLLPLLQAAFSAGKGRPVALVILFFFSFCNLASEWPANPTSGSFLTSLGNIVGTPFRSARKTLYDGYLRGNPRIPSSQPVAVVAIDEASLASLGQWPWPRNRLAALIDAIGGYHPSAIGLEIYMPERDQTSPGMVADNLPRSASRISRKLRRLPEHEAILADSLRRAPTILGAAGLDRSATTASKTLRSVPVATAEGDPLRFVRRFENVLASLPALQEASHGQALLTAELDHGVVRRIPLLSGIGETLVPGMAMEILRVANGAAAISAYADDRGVRRLRVNDIEVPTQNNGEAWLHFASIDETYGRYLSAKDVIAGTIDSTMIKGKIVLVGLTGAGLSNMQTTALGELVPGIEIHAQMIEAIIDGQFLLRPDWLKWVEMTLIAAFGLFMVWYVPRTESRLATFLRNVPRASIVLGLLLNGIILTTGFVIFSQTGLLVDAAAMFIVLSATMGSLISSATIEIDAKAKQAEALKQELRLEEAYRAGQAAGMSVKSDRTES